MNGIRSGAALAVLYAATACGGDATGLRSDPLSRSEAMALVSGIVESSDEATGSLSSGVLAPSFDGPSAGTITQTFRASHPCPSGGSVAFDLSLNATFDQATGSASFALGGTQVHSACAFPHGEIVLTVTGAPNLTFSSSGAVANHQPSAPFIVEIVGALAWSASDQRVGTCEVDIRSVTDFAAKRRTVNARVCEHTVNETLTWN